MMNMSSGINNNHQQRICYPAPVNTHKHQIGYQYWQELVLAGAGIGYYLNLLLIGSLLLIYSLLSYTAMLQGNTVTGITSHEVTIGYSVII